MEGGSEGKPDNVLFYATSNRRHIIQEKWSDRGTGTSEDAEIHTTDTLNEKLSLADRFGITITFPKPTPKEYINIVKVLLLNAILNLTKIHFSNRLCNGKSDRKVCLVEQQNNLSITLCGIHKRKINNILAIV